MKRRATFIIFTLVSSLLLPVSSSGIETKPVAFKVVGDDVFDFSPDRDLRVGSKPSKKLQRAWAMYNCPDSYSYTHVQVIGASRNVISSSRLRRDVRIKSAKWVIDENEENVFRIELSCLFEASLKLVQSGYYVFQLRDGDVFNDSSPRYDLETLKKNKWRITFYDFAKDDYDGFAWWDPALPNPVPKFQILRSEVANGVRTTELKMISSIYTTGKFRASRVADDYWSVYVYTINDERINYSSTSETFKVSAQEGKESQFLFGVDGTSYPSCSDNPKDSCRPVSWIFTLDSTGKQLRLDSTIRE